MRKPPAATLPDIDDEVFKERLAPLARAVLPAGPERTSPRVDGNSLAERGAGGSDSRHAGISDIRNDELGTSQMPVLPTVAALRPTRGPRRGVEFLLPEQVVIALKTEAAQRGTSMSVRVLEILRNAGYPVSDQDFIDLRKLPRK